MFYSLNKKGDFDKVFEHGRKFPSKYLVLYAHPNGLSISRLGFAVSRKIGNAVVRNRIKRRLREVFRVRVKEYPSGYDFVIVARSASAAAEFSDIDNNIRNIFRVLSHEKNSNNDNKGL